MSARFGVTFDVSQVAEALARIDDVFKRGTILQKGMRQALQPIRTGGAKEAPQPGRSGYWPRRGARQGRKMLHKTIGAVVRQYDNGNKGAVIVGVVGPEYPAGAVGHLVELGHRIVRGGSVAREASSRWNRKGTPRAKHGRTGKGSVSGRVAGRPYMRPAFEQHAPRATSIIVETVQKALAEGAK